MDRVLSAEATSAQLAGFLVAQRAKGETADEIAGLAEAMLRHARRVAPELDVRLLYSVRDPDHVLYRDELGDETTIAYTRRSPGGWTGLTGRLAADVIAAHVQPGATAFICGSHGFVDHVAGALAAEGLDWERIRTERWGPAGPD
jgi:ferredoxin-NADP reductase